MPSQGVIHRPSPEGKDLCLSRPVFRVLLVSAISAAVATTVFFVAFRILSFNPSVIAQTRSILPGMRRRDFLKISVPAVVAPAGRSAALRSADDVVILGPDQIKL